MRLAATTVLFLAPLLAVADYACAIYYDHELTKDADTNTAVNSFRDTTALNICKNLGGDRPSPADIGVVNKNQPHVCSLCRKGGNYYHEEDHLDRGIGPWMTYTYRCGNFAPGSCQYT
ncbi:hypothetical protein PTTW11_11217 [Pyrenophora teres f. teres]|uniref:Uncharacterized protein n=1 Tax=Pyrenophora teres f. teres TaxID=97479 RepID=A0A6S6WHI3_9PLEO|nr:hypothetical protein PTTW11_11217 [Pyrenophora teres f. teres]